MKKLFRLSTILAVSGAVAAGAFLFWTAQNVQKAEDELYALQQSAQSERKTIRVLEAEWSYLNRPDRLELLAREVLGMEAPAVDKVLSDPAALPAPMVPVLPAAKPVHYQPGEGAP